MDLKQIMRELHYGAQHFTNEERTSFDRVWKVFEKNGAIAQTDAPLVLNLYKKLKFLQIDPQLVIASLEANVLLLSPEEQTVVEGARYMYEYGSTVDTATLEKLLMLRQAVHQRQHNTLVTRDEGAAPKAPPPRAQPAPAPRPAPALPKRPSARHPGPPLQPIPALEAARKLLKG